MAKLRVQFLENLKSTSGILSMEMTMVAMVISELKSVVDLRENLDKFFFFRDPRLRIAVLGTT